MAENSLHHLRGRIPGVLPLNEDFPSADEILFERGRLLHEEATSIGWLVAAVRQYGAANGGIPQAVQALLQRLVFTDGLR